MIPMTDCFSGPDVAEAFACAGLEGQLGVAHAVQDLANALDGALVRAQVAGAVRPDVAVAVDDVIAVVAGAASAISQANGDEDGSGSCWRSSATDCVGRASSGQLALTVLAASRTIRRLPRARRYQTKTAVEWLVRYLRNHAMANLGAFFCYPRRSSHLVDSCEVCMTPSTNTSTSVRS